MASSIASAMEHGEFDFDGTKERKPQVPVALRGEAFRKELVELENIRYRLEGKDEVSLGFSLQYFCTCCSCG